MEHDGEDTTGVCKDIVILTGVRILVGVSPVLPSIRASKFKLENMLVGVSMGIPSILLKLWDSGLIQRLREAGRRGLEGRGMFSASSWVR